MGPSLLDMHKVGIILQARMGSTRLPGKILRPLVGKCILQRVAERLERVGWRGRLVIATSNLPNDNQVEEFCKAQGIHCFRGSESDVLERYFRCAEKHGFAHVVRLTGDNPFLDEKELVSLVQSHLKTESDYSNNFELLPIGVGSEIMTFKSLELSHQRGHLPHHREHVNEYLLENKDSIKYHLAPVPTFKVRPELRLTVDTPQDFEKAERILNELNSDNPPLEEILGLPFLAR